MVRSGGFATVYGRGARMLDALVQVGVGIRPEGMGVTWADVETAAETLPTFVREAGLWTTVVDLRPVTREHVGWLRDMVIEAYGAWEEPA